MQDMILNGTLLTGSWLSQERQRLGKARSEVVKAVGVHSATLRSIEDRNRVLPPGWYPALRELGMQFQEPMWPAQMVPYTGADLNRDLRTCSGLQPSRFWLSKQLCVAESAVGDVVRGNLPVPHSWLLKLAELGANVPAPARKVLRPPVREIQTPGPAGASRPALEVALRLPGEPVRASDQAPSSPLGAASPSMGRRAVIMRRWDLASRHRVARVNAAISPADPCAWTFGQVQFGQGGPGVLVGAASGELGQLVSEKWPVRSVDAEQLTAYRQPRGSEVHLVQIAAILNDDPGQAPAATSAKTKPASHPCIRS